MSNQGVRYTHLGAVVPYLKASKGSSSSRGILYRFTHRTRYAHLSAQELARMRSARLRRGQHSITDLKEQQQALSAALVAASKHVTTEPNFQASQLQVNVCEMVYSGLSPMTCDTYWSVLAQVTDRSVEQIANWFSNARLKRDKKGRSRVVQLAHPFFRDGGLKVYPDKVRKVEEMTLERFVQLVEAERDRQTILLGLDGFKRGNVALQEQAGTQPTNNLT